MLEGALIVNEAADRDAAGLALAVLAAAAGQPVPAVYLIDTHQLSRDGAIAVIAAYRKPVRLTAAIEGTGFRVHCSRDPAASNASAGVGIWQEWMKFIDTAIGAGAPCNTLLFQAPGVDIRVDPSTVAIFLRDYQVQFAASSQGYDDEARRAGVAGIIKLGGSAHVRVSQRPKRK